MTFCHHLLHIIINVKEGPSSSGGVVGHGSLAYGKSFFPLLFPPLHPRACLALCTLALQADGGFGISLALQQNRRLGCLSNFFLIGFGPPPQGLETIWERDRQTYRQRRGTTYVRTSLDFFNFLAFGTILGSNNDCVRYDALPWYNSSSSTKAVGVSSTQRVSDLFFPLSLSSSSKAPGKPRHER